MELWDIYDKDRVKTGRTMVRGDDFEQGAYHLVIHVCIFNAKGEMLIQQRQPFKEGWPDRWDVTVGGSALAGEDVRTAAERELKEELGLSLDLTGIQPYYTVNFDHGFDDFFLLEREVDPSSLHFQYEEVQGAKWATREEIHEMISDGRFIPYRHTWIDFLFDGRSGMGAIDQAED